MRVAFYIVSAILVGVIVAGFIYAYNSRMQRDRASANVVA
jgi:hypothetical protein